MLTSMIHEGQRFSENASQNHCEGIRKIQAINII